MIRRIAGSRSYLSLFLTVGIGILLSQHFQFPDENAILQLVAVEKPAIFIAIKYAYRAMLFSTPFIGCLDGTLPPLYILRSPSPPASRERLSLVIGGLHHPKRPEPAEQPSWLTIPDRGLYTGIAIFGAIGSGKTSCFMDPFAEQILAYRAGDFERRAGGLVLEVKGDFWHKVRKILKQYGREVDYVEVSLDCPYRYNRLHNDLEAYALAYGIASSGKTTLLTALAGFIADRDRIVLIEDTSEVQMVKPNLVRFEARRKIHLERRNGQRVVAEALLLERFDPQTDHYLTSPVVTTN